MSKYTEYAKVRAAIKYYISNDRPCPKYLYDRYVEVYNETKPNAPMLQAEVVADPSIKVGLDAQQQIDDLKGQVLALQQQLSKCTCGGTGIESYKSVAKLKKIARNNKQLCPIHLTYDQTTDKDQTYHKVAAEIVEQLGEILKKNTLNQYDASDIVNAEVMRFHESDSEMRYVIDVTTSLKGLNLIYSKNWGLTNYLNKTTI